MKEKLDILLGEALERLDAAAGLVRAIPELDDTTNLRDLGRAIWHSWEVRERLYRQWPGLRPDFVAESQANSKEGSAGILPALREKSGQDARAPVAAAAIEPPATHDACGQDARAPVSAPPGASFYDPFGEMDVTTHKLPHWNQADCYCFVTWRLADAMPQEKLAEWEVEREVWLKAHPEPWAAVTAREYHRRFSNRLDEWLDAGHGKCLLKDPGVRKIVADALAHFDSERYALAAFVVMPNHAHVLLRLKAGHSLAVILHSWKSFTAKAINKALNRAGSLWQPEYWDRLIRSERHFAACLGYIRDNPRKARLGSTAYTLWERSAGDPAATRDTCGQDARAPVATAVVAPQEEEGSAGILPALRRTERP